MSRVGGLLPVRSVNGPDNAGYFADGAGPVRDSRPRAGLLSFLNAAHFVTPCGQRRSVGFK
ncbi:hypothetical protein GCM10010343_28260 [Streptomyces avidinii]|uniref:Uncharacterized protein n=1 Tax=Streptomyces avidinii TaxID=1895 RepID=A0ABS4L021_STRAV|nr:hypothetical protein [Streptomyces avidinii]GGZ00828.1 hypothetical protein GCM10010343_28260 [Streptomyces avidinii]